MVLCKITIPQNNFVTFAAAKVINKNLNNVKIMACYHIDNLTTKIG